MGNWNRHFVRVGSDGNVGMFDTTNEKFVYLNSTTKEFIIAPSPGTSSGYLGISRSNQALNTVINGIPESQIIMDDSGNLTLNAQGISDIIFNSIINSQLSTQRKFVQYAGINTSLYGFATLSGSPDLRIGVTAADASPITIFSSTQSVTRYEVKARILATAGTSATYKIVWTEDGVAQPVSLTITAVDTEVHDNFVIAPDAGTDITAQITSLTSSTVNVDAIVSVLG